MYLEQMIADKYNLHLINRPMFSIAKLQITGVGEKHNMFASYGMHFSVVLLRVKYKVYHILTITSVEYIYS